MEASDTRTAVNVPSSRPTVSSKLRNHRLLKRDPRDRRCRLHPAIEQGRLAGIDVEEGALMILEPCSRSRRFNAVRRREAEIPKTSSTVPATTTSRTGLSPSRTSTRIVLPGPTASVLARRFDRDDAVGRPTRRDDGPPRRRPESVPQPEQHRSLHHVSGLQSNRHGTERFGA